MKFCPSPDCPYALRHREAQEYRDEATVCSDCGAALVLERPALVTPPSPGTWPLARIALTLLALPLPGLLLRFVALPGHYGSLLAPPVDDPFGEPLPMSVFSLGLGPVLTAFLLIEVAALAKPEWRHLRHGGPEGRRRLSNAATRLALLLAAGQALAIVSVLQQQDVLPTGRGSRSLLVVFSLVAGTCAFVVVAQFLDRSALGGGFALLGVAAALPALEPFLDETKELAAGLAPGFMATSTGLILAVVATVLVLRRPRAGERPGLRGPACGILPLQQGASFLLLAGTLASVGLWSGALDPGRLEPWAWWAAYVSLTALLAVLWGVLFNPSRQVAQHAPRGRAEVRRAVIAGLIYTVGLALLGLVLDLAFGVRGPDLVVLAMVVALGLDALGEAHAFRRHPSLVAVWPEHRLFAIDGGLAVLEQAGIPCFARSAHQRALWHFFAPAIPIQILVPADRAEEAHNLLHQHFLEGSTVSVPEVAAAP